MRCVIKDNAQIDLEKNEPVFAEEGICHFGVKACGICGSDIPRVFNHGAYHYPIVVGHEFSGVVKDSKNRELIGKRACVFPILPCGECEYCKGQQWANCLNYDYYGSRRDGGMQTDLLIKESNLILLPDNVSFEAGAMIEPMAVCLHAIRKTSISKDSSVLIYGAGTIGLLCAMWAKAFGARDVFIHDIDGKRMEMAKGLGFSAYSGSSVNAVIEASGSDIAINNAISACEAMGKIILVGHGTKDVCIKHNSFIQILRKQLTVFGSWNSDHFDLQDDWYESIKAIEKGIINPEKLITHKIPLQKAKEAFETCIDKNVFSNKVMVVMQNEL